ncbi:urease accessory UreF family protein [Pelomonas sp. APW6]|uniref:Urease accessory protein UreF n=1 Tax=Roseateles subflavus TaxID=3053353 RepID=A0ABT7LBT6_9BURK|nr:urease accessory UreF family protein [Pelomonas sp. APW6]MDL5030313.1 urease accessory UreF family protein [Pelomonas sp. APW6]
MSGTGAGDRALLRLLCLASPALPVGGFSYSEGLEAAVEAGEVRDEASARDWLLAQCRLGPCRAELPLTLQAWRAWARQDAGALQALNTHASLTRESAEFRLQGEQMAHSLLLWLRDAPLRDPALPALLGDAVPQLPLVWGLALHDSGADERAGILAVAMAWTENQVQAAMKAVPLGQRAGQRLLQALCDALADTIDELLARADAPTPPTVFTPMLAVLSARHEHQYSRLFRS